MKLIDLVKKNQAERQANKFTFSTEEFEFCHNTINQISKLLLEQEPVYYSFRLMKDLYQNKDPRIEMVLYICKYFANEGFYVGYNNDYIRVRLPKFFTWSKGIYWEDNSFYL